MISNSGSGTLAYNEAAMNLATDGNNYYINDPGTLIPTGNFVPSATIPMLSSADSDSNGTPDDLEGVAITGTFQINGVIGELGFNTSPLLMGELQAYRSPRTVVMGNDVYREMNFLSKVTGGSAAGLYGFDMNGPDAYGILFLPNTSGPLTVQERFFETSFSRMGVQGDFLAANVVPEPGSLLMGLIGVVGVVAGARLRRRRPLQAGITIDPALLDGLSPRSQICRFTSSCQP